MGGSVWRLQCSACDSHLKIFNPRPAERWGLGECTGTGGKLSELLALSEFRAPGCLFSKLCSHKNWCFF